jgi:hypothetical protein
MQRHAASLTPEKAPHRASGQNEDRFVVLINMVREEHGTMLRIRGRTRKRRAR